MTDEIFTKRLDSFEWSVRTGSTLRNENIETIGDLVVLTEKRLKRVPNFGPKSLLEVKEFLVSHGLRLGMEAQLDEQARRELTAHERRLLEPGTLSLCLRTVGDHVRAACAIHRISHFNRKAETEHHIDIVEARLAEIEFVVRSWAHDHGGSVQ